MSQPSSVSIRLICQESLQAERITCGILESTVNATFVCRALDCLQDGRHAASYDGRDKTRVGIGKLAFTALRFFCIIDAECCAHVKRVVQKGKIHNSDRLLKFA